VTFQWNLAARVASKRPNCKGPPGLPCAVTPLGTWPPCVPSNPITIMRIFGTNICPVGNSHPAESWLFGGLAGGRPFDRPRGVPHPWCFPTPAPSTLIAAKHITVIPSEASRRFSSSFASPKESACAVYPPPAGRGISPRFFHSTSYGMFMKTSAEGFCVSTVANDHRSSPKIEAALRGELNAIKRKLDGGSVES
jgi:hypothetical protein